jgi:hypothetical protein
VPVDDAVGVGEGVVLVVVGAGVADPHLPDVHAFETHSLPSAQELPSVFCARQSFAVPEASQYVPAAQSVDVVHVAVHCASVHTALVHSTPFVHAAPPAFLSTQAAEVAEVSQYFVAAQSVSAAHVVAGAPHFPAVQTPPRQTVAAFPAVHPLLPSASPHLSSFVSHTPDLQTAVPTSVEHFPSSAGVCDAIVGIAVPLSRWRTHDFAAVSQNCVPSHCASAVHASVHAPVSLQT